MTTLTEIAEHAGIRERFGILARPPAWSPAADPQPGHARRQHLAGHPVLGILPPRVALLPRRREHLLRRHADGHQPRARDPDADRCVSGEPSDTAPALIALDAQLVIRRRGSERGRRRPSGPGTDITRMTVLQPGELLTAIRIPATWARASTSRRCATAGGTSRW